MENKPTRGGKRAGSGKPIADPATGEHSKTYPLLSAPALIRKVDAVRGKQNRSAWIREAIETKLKGLYPDMKSDVHDAILANMTEEERAKWVETWSKVEWP